MLNTPDSNPSSSPAEVCHTRADAVRFCRLAGFDWILVETSGIGQGDVGIRELADLAVYVMTPDFGAPSRLEAYLALPHVKPVIGSENGTSYQTLSVTVHCSVLPLARKSTPA